MNKGLQMLQAKTWMIIPAALFFVAAISYAQESPPLRLEKTISLSGVKGRIDHMGAYPSGQRLFIAALGNNTLEVIDTNVGERIRTIEGLSEPQGVLYLPNLDRIFVTNGGDGSCRIFNGSSFKLLGEVKYPDDADNIRYDFRRKTVYVGYGKGALGLFDPGNGRRIGDIQLAGHPESFQLEENGSRIFVNVPSANYVAVVDREKLKVVSSWPLPGAKSNFPMALDEHNHRLFVGCREPAKMIVYDTESGKIVGRVDIGGDADDIFYDAGNKRLYVSCGEGFLEVFRQLGPDQYKLDARIPTAQGARTSLFVSEQGKLYLAVPHKGKQRAEVRVYAIGNSQEK